MLLTNKRGYKHHHEHTNDQKQHVASKYLQQAGLAGGTVFSTSPFVLFVCYQFVKMIFES